MIDFTHKVCNEVAKLWTASICLAKPYDDDTFPIVGRHSNTLVTWEEDILISQDVVLF